MKAAEAGRCLLNARQHLPRPHLAGWEVRGHGSMIKDPLSFICFWSLLPTCLFLFLFMSYFSEELRFIQKSTGQEGAVGDCSLPQVPQASLLPRGPLAAESPGIFQPQ